MYKILLRKLNTWIFYLDDESVFQSNKLDVVQEHYIQLLKKYKISDIKVIYELTIDFDSVIIDPNLDDDKIIDGGEAEGLVEGGW